MGAYSNAVIADGASHYWRLGEPSGTVAADSISGGANAPGTISGGVTLGQPGPLADGSTAMAFDGTAGMILTAALTIPHRFTWEWWGRTGPVATRVALAALQATGFSFSQHMQVDPTGTITMNVIGSTLTSVRVVTDGAWHHVVVTLDTDIVTGVWTLYLDGVAEATRTSGHDDATGQLTIGQYGTNTSFNWLGGLAEVAVYPAALTPAQIANHYALRTAAAGGGAPAVPWPAALVGVL